MSRNKLWSVYCADEQIFVNTLSVSKPTECPNNAAHAIRGVRIVDETPDRVFLYNDNGILKTDDTNSPDTSLTLNLQSSIQIWILYEEQDEGTNGGTFTKGSWVIRTLNTIDTSQGDSSVTLSANEFTLQPGKYYITVKCPAYQVDAHMCRLFDTTVSSPLDQINGTTAFAKNRDSEYTTSEIETTLDLSQARTFRIEHQCTKTKGSDGFGVAVGFSGIKEKYSIVKINKFN